MAISTIYDIRVRMMLSDKGTKAAMRMVKEFRGLRKEVDGVQRSASGIGSAFGRLAGAAAGAFGLYQAKSALIDFNSTMEQSRVQIAGMLSQATGEEFGKSMGVATDMVSKLQLKARESVGTTKDMVDMASMLVRPLSAAGLKQEDIVNMTASSVVASKAFGIQADMAARDIESALMGQLSARDRFARALLESKSFGGKFVGEEGRRSFNSMNEGQRAATVQQALNAPGIASMAKAQEKSFAGVTSTLQDNLQMALGKIGLPLFQAITKEVIDWNKWIDANGAAIKQFGSDASHFLVEGFKMAKDAAGFLVQHKALLLTLAKAWLAGKAVKGLVGGFVDIGSMLQGLTQGAGGGLAGLTKAAGGAAVALGGVAAGAVALADWINTQQDRGLKHDMDASSVGNRLGWAADGKISQETLYKQFLKDGLLNKDGTYNNARGGLTGASHVGKQAYDINDDQYMSTESINKMLMQGKIAAEAASAKVMLAGLDMVIAAFSGKQRDATLGILAGLLKGGKTDTGKTASQRDINVTIKNVQVASDDPDRFVVGLANLAEDAIKNQSTARGSLRY